MEKNTKKKNVNYKDQICAWGVEDEKFHVLKKDNATKALCGEPVQDNKWVSEDSIRSYEEVCKKCVRALKKNGKKKEAKKSKKAKVAKGKSETKNKGAKTMKKTAKKKNVVMKEIYADVKAEHRENKKAIRSLFKEITVLSGELAELTKKQTDLTDLLELLARIKGGGNGKAKAKVAKMTKKGKKAKKRGRKPGKKAKVKKEKKAKKAKAKAKGKKKSPAAKINARIKRFMEREIDGKLTKKEKKGLVAFFKENPRASKPEVSKHFWKKVSGK